MDESEMKIGRLFGATPFFIYQSIKHAPFSSCRDLEEDTGISDRSIQQYLRQLVSCNILVKGEEVVNNCRVYVYTSNEDKSAWILH